MTYLEFIANIIQTRGQYNIPNDEVYENHHIVPKCLGGLGDYKNGSFKKQSTHTNCIRLYPREHFIAHKLLALENPNNPKLVWSWQAMWMLNESYIRYEPTPEEYEQRKVLLRECGVSEETKKKVSKAVQGEKNPNYGHKWNEEQRENLRKQNLGKEIYWWNNGVINTMAKECPGIEWKRGRLGGFKHKSNENYHKFKRKVHTAKYLWKLPDGSFKIADMGNTHRWHPDWILVKKVEDSKYENTSL